MSRITDLLLRDVRCFAGEQSAKIGRITLLLGENSSGKSTFLGCYNTLAKLAGFIDLDDSNHFDDPPFHMGSFETIARSEKNDFSIGGRFADHCHSDALFEFTADKVGTPVERQVQLGFRSETKNRTLQIEWLPPSDALRFTASSLQFDLPRSAISYAPISTWLSRYVRHGYVPYNGDAMVFRMQLESPELDSTTVAFGKFVSFLRSELPLPSEPSFSIHALNPELPSRMRRYPSEPPYFQFDSGTKLGEFEKDRQRLGEVGRSLGLWDSISVTPLALSQEWQVLVDTPNGKRNVFDVGYGIHSLLPLLDAILSTDRETVFLLQQPEIHLHPYAQAKIAQFFAESNHSFLIETHSEHITDRFRICVMEGTLQPNDLSVLYFESSSDGKCSRIHSIGVDSDGNLLDVPTSYRSFFLHETERLLGFSE